MFSLAKSGDLFTLAIAAGAGFAGGGAWQDGCSAWWPESIRAVQTRTSIGSVPACPWLHPLRNWRFQQTRLGSSSRLVGRLEEEADGQRPKCLPLNHKHRLCPRRSESHRERFLASPKISPFALIAIHLALEAHLCGVIVVSLKCQSARAPVR